ncbi:hypothetical protein C8Q73DRAFT_719126 [Cubamyces lactineus]|nr:hypothetical protein C8Q73DRAFT_719126 [Cubamyces lactineus]
MSTACAVQRKVPDSRASCAYSVHVARPRPHALMEITETGGGSRSNCIVRSSLVRSADASAPLVAGGCPPAVPRRNDCVPCTSRAALAPA